MFSAVIHDAGHPGLNTLFLLNTKHDLSIEYNDTAPLENYHLFLAFSELKGLDKNFLSQLQPSQYKLLRKMTIKMVLLTDMAQHFNLNDNIRNKVDSKSLDMVTDKEDLLSFVLHCADINAQTRSWEIALIWGQKISLEFFQQGDKERELGIPISNLCDRYTVNVGLSQIG
jgi:hypothetical protein